MFYQHNFEQFVGNLHDPNQLLIDLKKLGVLHEAKVLQLDLEFVVYLSLTYKFQSILLQNLLS
jgi:hypothetical protein